MMRKTITRVVMTGMVLGAFTLGYVTGSVSQRQADAQGLGGVLDKATGSSPLGAASQLGSSILEMQDHVTGLQKNIDTLKKVQSALTGK